MFFSGIHMDMLGALEAPALIGSSNPGAFTSMPGGASLNTASVGALLGLDCSVIGLVGDDAGGIVLAQALNDRRITNLLTVKKDRTTGSYTSIIEPDGNLHIALADLGLNEEMSAKWLLSVHAQAMGQCDLWFLNANLSTQTLKILSNRNLNIRPKILAGASISPSKAQKLVPSLANFDVLFTNIAEASAMLNVVDGKPYDAAQLSAEICIARLQEMGIERGSLSQGKDVLWVWDEAGTHKFVPPKLEKIADVTGAGDALAGAFLSGLAQGITMSERAPLAIAAAQMTVSVTGPYNKEISTKLSNEKNKTT